MNRNTRFMFGGQDRPRRDKFKGHSGQKRKKQLLSIKERKIDALDKEIADLRARYSKVCSVVHFSKNFMKFLGHLKPFLNKV